MDDTSHISPLRRWLESILVWYILFMILYLIARFVVRSDWRFIALVNNGAPYLFFPVIVGLLIALLLRARRLSGVYFLVVLLGLLWLAPPLIPKQLISPDLDGTAVEIISFNLYPDNSELDQAAEWITGHSPDILAVQDMPDDMSSFANIEESYEYSVSQSLRKGNAVYSRFPILESEDVPLDDWLIQRIILDIEATQVVLYNVHIIMPLNEREADWVVLRYDETRRNSQIEQLLALVSEETLPVIVVGDLNMTEWSPIYREIAAQLNDAYRHTSWGIGATFPAGQSEDFGGGYPRLFRLDYVWYSDPIEASYAIVGANLGSDHLPLRVELVVP